MRINIPVPNASSVTAGQTATWKVPVGLRYHEFQVTYAGVTLAQITAIRIKANGETIQTCSAAERDSLNQYDGRAAAGGILTLPLDRFGLYRQDGEEMTALRTGVLDRFGRGITSVDIEMDIDAAAAAPAISINATASDNPPDPNGVGAGTIMRLKRFSRGFTAAAEFEWSDMPKATEGTPHLVINRVAFKSAATLVIVERDNRQIFKRTKTLNDRVQLDGVRVPQAGYFVVDPSEQGYDFEPINLVKPDGIPYADFRYKLTLPGAETAVALVEYLGTLN